MTRVFFFLLAVVILAAGAAWIADHPGEVILNWQGWRVETSVAVLIVAVAMLVLVVMALWTVFRLILGGPTALAGYFRSRRREKGMRALSLGMIAAGAGDQKRARRHAAEARKLMKGEPLTLLLQAQAAQLAGDRESARRAFADMLNDPDTEILGLRGLYIEAQRAGDETAARHHATRAAERAPGVGWAANALLEFHTREGDWEAAIERIERNAGNHLIDKQEARRARAVLLAAEARDREESDPEGALERALEAHRLAPELVPAAAIAGRLLADDGNTRQATRVLEKTWRLAPHPEIADIYLHARPGDSARDRLKRARVLAGKQPGEPEGRIAIATAAIEARDWTAAREALGPLLRDGPTRRVALLMAAIEDGEHGDSGRAREWLARALRAPRDKAWVADGFVSAAWAPVSPVSGRLDAFEWTTPPEAIETGPILYDDDPDPQQRGPEHARPIAPMPAGHSDAAPASPGASKTEPTPGDPPAGGAKAEAAGPPSTSGARPDRPLHGPAATSTNSGNTDDAAREPGAADRAAPGSSEADILPRPPDDPGPDFETEDDSTTAPRPSA